MSIISSVICWVGAKTRAFLGFTEFVALNIFCVRNTSHYLKSCIPVIQCYEFAQRTIGLKLVFFTPRVNQPLTYICFTENWFRTNSEKLFMHGYIIRGAEIEKQVPGVFFTILSSLHLMEEMKMLLRPIPKFLIEKIKCR